MTLFHVFVIATILSFVFLFWREWCRARELKRLSKVVKTKPATDLSSSPYSLRAAGVRLAKARRAANQ